MCGVCGIYHDERSGPPDFAVLSRMLESIEHRGPDAEGRFHAPQVALGMRRLSIIDLAGGNQPIYNESGDVAVVFNGEIYNYIELRESLRKKGHRFATDSDTEVIVHLYEEFGDDCVNSLRGMFAFALWDSRRQRLLVARDRVGIKPLYYCVVRGKVIFGSEIKALLCHPDVPAQIDHGSLKLYLSLKYVPAPQTLFSGIQSLPPGHLFSCDRDGVHVRQYWDIPVRAEGDGELDEQTAVEQLDDLLLNTVKLHLRSDVPFGAFLSGGVDSSLIVALMSRAGQTSIKTFSIGYDDSHGERDERRFAKVVANRFQTDHHEVLINPHDFIRMAETVCWHLDQPLADEATYATYALSDLAARQVKMVLTGEGGDELFAGYARYIGESFSGWYGMLPNWVKRLALASTRRIPGLRRPKLALHALSQSDEAARLTEWFPVFNRDMVQRLLSREALERANGASPVDVFARHLTNVRHSEPLNRMLYIDSKLWLPDLLLMRGDKMSMAHSLEARVPLLDHEVVEFAARLPAKLKLSGFTTKYLLKKVARKYLPDEIVDRKKAGFPIPISGWLRGPARTFMRDLLARETIERRGLLNPDYVEQLIDDHESHRADYGNNLWALMSLELWQRAFIDNSSRRTANSSKPSANGNGAHDLTKPGISIAGR